MGAAAFSIDLDELRPRELRKIYEHIRLGPDLRMPNSIRANEWMIYESNGRLHGCVLMERFCMWTFLERIGVDMDKVSFKRYY